MSCPDWTAAAAWRHGDGAAPPGWQADLAHLAGCALCRRRVARLDPSLLVAAAAATVPPVGVDEAGGLRAGVRSLLAAERLASAARPDRRPLAAAAALLALLALPLGLGRQADRAPAPAALAPPAASPPPAAAEPPVEEVQPAGARIYQFGTEELPVVLIFDDNLDL